MYICELKYMWSMYFLPWICHFSSGKFKVGSLCDPAAAKECGEGRRAKPCEIHC